MRWRDRDMTAQNSIAEKSFFGRYFLYKLRTNFNYLVFNLIFAFLATLPDFT